MGKDYYPVWLDNLADDVTLEAPIDPSAMVNRSKEAT
jgi:hypothetical protein